MIPEWLALITLFFCLVVPVLLGGFFLVWTFATDKHTRKALAELFVFCLWAAATIIAIVSLDGGK